MKIKATQFKALNLAAIINTANEELAAIDKAIGYGAKLDGIIAGLRAQIAAESEANCGDPISRIYMEIMLAELIEREIKEDMRLDEPHLNHFFKNGNID